MSRHRKNAERPRRLDAKRPADPGRSATAGTVLLGAAVLVAAAVVAYGPALRGGYVWDDPRYVTENPTLTTPGGLYHIWFDLGATIQYYPLVFTSFWIEHRLWELEPLGYHLTNVLLHAANAVLVWFVLRRLSAPGAWLAAGIFALHPVHVESVAWITERKNVLSGLFCLSALLAYLRFAPPDTDGPSPGRRWRFYALAVVLFVCALLSKTVTCTLPAVTVLLLWWRRGRIGRPDVVALTPLFAVGAALAVTTIWLEKHNVGAEGQAWDLSFVQRYLIAGRALWFYAGKLVWPLPLVFTYPKWQIDAGQWWQYLYPAAAVVLVLVLWALKRRVGRGPLVAALCFGGMLLPALGFVDVYPMRYSYVADHFQYLASIAPIALFVAVITTVARLLPSGRGFLSARAGSTDSAPAVPIGRWALAGTLLLILAVLTWRQGRIYKNVETLWRDTLTKNPAAFMAHNNLGSVLEQQGQIEQAMQHYSQALRLEPACHEAHYNLGQALLNQGRFEQAAEHYAAAVRIKPDFPNAHNNLGYALARLGKAEQAIEHYREALKLAPDLASAHLNLANALARRGRFAEAIERYQQALRLEPAWALAHKNLAHALAESRRFDEAIAAYTQALRIQPRDLGIRCDLADLLTELGRCDEAIAAYLAVLRIDPQYERARRGLATAQARRGGD